MNKNHIAVLSFILLIPAASASESNFRIDSFKLLSDDLNFVRIEISGKGKPEKDLCLTGSAKSNDGTIYSFSHMPSLIEAGEQPGTFISVIRVTPPIGAGPRKSDVLFVLAASCVGQSNVVANKRFDWPHEWAREWPPGYGQVNPARDSALAVPEKIFEENVLSEDFVTIDNLLKKWGQQEERDQDGDWKLSSFSKALETSYTQSINPLYWEQSQQRIKRWKVVSPKTGGLAEARYWLDYAWSIRGWKSASNTDPYAMKLFYQRLKKAEQALMAVRTIKDSNPVWYEMYLRVVVDMKKDTKFTESIFDEAIKTYPYYIPLYRIMTDYWADPRENLKDWKELDKLVNRATAYTFETDGDSNYARIYGALAWHKNDSENIFQNSPVSWSKMKSAFETMIKRYPSPFNLNEFAFLACQANDKTTFLTLRPRIEKQLMPELWPSNTSIDLCQQKFMQKS